MHMPPLTLTPTTRAAAVQTIATLQESLRQAASDAEVAHIEDQLVALQRMIRASQWEPYPWQHPHVHPDGWVSERNGQSGRQGVCDPRCFDLPAVTVPAQGTWLEYGGRGTGKTEGAAHYVDAHVNGPACDHRIAGGHKLIIIGPTQGDAVEACVEGVSGLKAINPAVTISTHRGGTFVRWPNGSRARILGASTKDDVDSTRASGNNCLIWLEEAAAMRRLADVRLVSAPGLRIGDHAHYVLATTPVNRPEMQAISADPDTIVTKGRTRDAHKLNPADRVKWEERYGGTTMGRQELDAEELGDVAGALWVADRPDLVDGEPNKDERPGIEQDRVGIERVGWRSHVDGAPEPTAAQLVERVVISVDPPGGRTEAGITVIGSIGAHAFVLADLSIAGPPDTWAKIAIQAHYDYGAEGIAAEHAYGGDMVDDVIGTRDSSIPIFRVPTKVGKRLRAEPVQAISQQHRLHMVGVHPKLEGEMTSWVAGEGESPNRLDAMVHGVTYLVIRAKTATTSAPGAQPIRPARRA